MSQAGKSAVRCAIYTRKSSEEGLDQAFNSLQAQREACEAYIASQVGEGWRTLPAVYDDGGYSGGNIERPALQRLLADVRAGAVDTVVVYKIDRLTRALGDFAKIVETFDAAGASFVSVTQAFNTTTSMGRLTLNVLLSFAQFEREVTGERIRDKIAASKAKGMWMGGNLPLGYDAPTTPGRTLAVNEAEAETVRLVFRKYLELGSVATLERWLADMGVRSKSYVSRRGHQRGGGLLGRGALFHLLKNRVYLGDIVHKDCSYPGAHPAIVDEALFRAVQAQISQNAAAHLGRPTVAGKAAFKGMLFGADGRPMSPTHTRRHGRLYRYYASAPLVSGRKLAASDAIRRVSALELERLVLERACDILNRGSADEVLPLVERIELHPELISVVLLRPSGCSLIAVQRSLAEGEVADLRDHDKILLQLPVRAKFWGGRSWLMASGRRPTIDPVLVAALRKARRLASEHGLLGQAGSRISAPANPYERKLVLLAFLSPEIQRDLLTGLQPAGLRLEHIIAEPPPHAWSDQTAWLRRIASA